MEPINCTNFSGSCFEYNFTRAVSTSYENKHLDISVCFEFAKAHISYCKAATIEVSQEVEEKASLSRSSPMKFSEQKKMHQCKKEVMKTFSSCFLLTLIVGNPEPSQARKYSRKSVRKPVICLDFSSSILVT